MKKKRPENIPGRLIILGSTGSVGTKALEAVEKLPPGRFDVRGLAAGKNLRLLKKQIERHRPRMACVASVSNARRLEDFAAGISCRVFSGESGLLKLARAPGADVIFNAVVGVAGLQPTLAALELGRTVLMANKEGLVAGGELIRATADNFNSTLIPVDSEHSAIFQCLQGRKPEEVRRVILTASGGPFLERKRLDRVTPGQALAHPRWKMGPKVSVDSATLMNKGLELIEASRLFGLRPDQLSVVIHPECIVHSMIELTDGAVIAQLAEPDMMIPVRYALTWPDRAVAPEVKSLNLADTGKLTFTAPDESRFPCLAIASAALERGGLSPAALNAADETAVAAFLRGAIRFTDIAAVIETAIESLSSRLDGDPLSIREIMETDAAARLAAIRSVRSLKG